MMTKQPGLAVLLGWVAACGGATAARAPERAARIERVERGLAPPVQVRGEEVRWTLAERMREHKIPAVGIAVFDHYELQWAAAYGVADLATGERATERTLFLAGSISKPVNALAQLLAAADGTLALDAPINDALAAWKLPDNELTRARPVTLRMLLSHTAGTTVHGFAGYAAGSPIPTVPQVLDGLPPANSPAVRVDLAPGTAFRYSGGGITISQLALAERSKRGYPEILADRVLRPLHMDQSTFEQALPPDRLRLAAAGHDAAGAPIAGKRHAYPEMAAAGLWTTPSDLARFFLAIARARAHRPSPVPSPVALQMTTKVVDIEGGPNAIGLGVFLQTRNGVRFFGHGGADAGFQADALVSLDGGFGVVIMTNSDNGHAIFDELERAVFAAYGWPGADAAISRVALDGAARAALAGRFSIAGAPLEIAERAGKLVARAPFEPPGELVPIAPDTVVDVATGARLRFDARGPVELTPRRGPAREVARAATRAALFELEDGRFDAAVAALRAQLEAEPARRGAVEDELNRLGYRLVATDVTQAIAVLRLVATVVPDSSNAHDSLGEVYLIAGDKPNAIAAYERAVAAIDADPRLAPEDRRARRAHADEQLARLRAP